MDTFNEKINLDDLYKETKYRQEKRTEVYIKVLNRVHKKIKACSRQKHNNCFCCFVVPEFILGFPRYDIATCTAFLIDKLRDNGFNIKYTHPNLLFISWKYWVPDYVRNEIKKKTGTKIDGNGNIIQDNNNTDNTSSSSSHIKSILKPNTKVVKKEDEKKYTSINSYTPTGNSVYSNQIIQKIQDKV